MKSLAIIGIGSPFGEDQLGWRALRYLRDNVAPGDSGEFIEMDRPGACLIESLREYQAVILIDALSSDSSEDAKEPILLLDARDLARDGGRCSSHGFGVAESLALAAALAELPSELSIFGLRRGGDEVFASLAGMVAEEVGRMRATDPCA